MARLRFTRSARRDLLDLWLHIAKDDPRPPIGASIVSKMFAGACVTIQDLDPNDRRLAKARES